MDIASMLMHPKCPAQFLTSKILERKPIIHSLYANHKDWGQLFSVVRRILMADPPHPLEQFTFYWDTDIQMLLEGAPKQLHVKRLFVRHVPGDLKGLLKILESGTFPNLEHLEISLGSVSLYDQAYASRNFGANLEFLAGALRGCGPDLRILALSPPEIYRQIIPDIVGAPRNGPAPSVDKIDMELFQKLNLNLKGIHGVFPAITTLMYQNLDVDELFLKCYNGQTKLGYFGWIQEVQRMLGDFRDLIDINFHAGGHQYSSTPVEWIASRVGEVTPFAKRLEPDGLSCKDFPPSAAVWQLIGKLLYFAHASNSTFNPSNILIPLFEVDRQYFVDCVRNLLLWQIPYLLRDTNLAWRQTYIDVNQIVNGNPLSIVVSHDARSIIELLKHPELDVNARSANSETLLEHLFQRSPRPTGLYQGPTDIREAFRLLLEHPLLDTSTVSFPQNVEGVNLLLSHQPLLDLFCKKFKNHETMLTNGVIGKSHRHPAWLKKFRRIFSTLKSENLCRGFVYAVWKHLLQDESNPATFEKAATELAQVFSAETPSFVYTAAHGAKKDFKLETKLKFENIKRIMQKILRPPK
jgi:hypothetical protein